MRDKLFGQGGIFGGGDSDLLDPNAAARWQALPSSPNIQSGTPLSWAEQDVLETRPEFTGPSQYGNKLAIYHDSHPMDPNSWANQHLPANLPTGPLTDPNAAADPSILARQRMPQQQPYYWDPSWTPPSFGTTLNSMPSS